MRRRHAATARSPARAAATRRRPAGDAEQRVGAGRRAGRGDGGRGGIDLVVRAARERVAQRDQPLAEVAGGGEAQVVRGDVGGAVRALGHGGGSADAAGDPSPAGVSRCSTASRPTSASSPDGVSPGPRPTSDAAQSAMRSASPRASARSSAGSSPPVRRLAARSAARGRSRDRRRSEVGTSCAGAGRHTRAPRTSSTSPPIFRCPARPTTASPAAIGDPAGGQAAGHSEVGV